LAARYFHLPNDENSHRVGSTAPNGRIGDEAVHQDLHLLNRRLLRPSARPESHLLANGRRPAASTAALIGHREAHHRASSSSIKRRKAHTAGLSAQLERPVMTAGTFSPQAKASSSRFQVKTCLHCPLTQPCPSTARAEGLLLKASTAESMTSVHGTLKRRDGRGRCRRGGKRKAFQSLLRLSCRTAS
jgi:hypothetical protein